MSAIFMNTPLNKFNAPKIRNFQAKNKKIIFNNRFIGA